MADNNETNNNQAAVLAAMFTNQETNSLDQIREQYKNDKLHDFNNVKTEALARREEFRAEREHEDSVKLESSIQDLIKSSKEEKLAGNIEKSLELSKQASTLRNTVPTGDAFETDEVTKNFAATLDELMEGFIGSTTDEMSISIKRMTESIDAIGTSSAVEKDFLLEQFQKTRAAMEEEYKQKTSIVAKTMDSIGTATERYLDFNSLYSGFVDNNPIMMLLFKIGADLVKRNRQTNKLSKEAIKRDKRNAAFSEKLQKESIIKNQTIEAREEALFNQRQETARLEKEHTDSDVQESQGHTSLNTANESFNFIENSTESDPGDQELTQGFMSELFSGIEDETGDPPLEPSFVQSMFDGIEDETGDPPLEPSFVQSMFDGIEDETGDPEPFIISQEQEPIRVVQEPVEPTLEQVAQDQFVRDNTIEQQRENTENIREQAFIEQRTYEKLVDIESAILGSNKLIEEGNELTEDDDSGLVAVLGLRSLAGAITGPLGKVVTILGAGFGSLKALLGKSLGGSLKGSKRVASKIGKGSKGLLSKGAKGAGGLLKTGAKGLASVAGPLAALAGAGAAGYAAGSYINDNLLSDDTKSSLADNIGSGVDNVLSFFGNDDAQKRLDTIERAKSQSGQTLGTPSSIKETTEKNVLTMEKESKGNNLVVNVKELNSVSSVSTGGTPTISSGSITPVNTQSTAINNMEEKITVIKEANDNNQVPIVMPSPGVKQAKTKSGDPTETPIIKGVSARNNESSIQRVTDRFVGYGM